MTMSSSWSLAYDTWDGKEQEAMKEVIDSGRFTAGPKVLEFEKAFAKKMRVPYAVMVNSGGSANLLMVALAVETGRLERGNKIIVPAVGWSTSYFPFIQYGIDLVFVDVDKQTWNIDVEQVRKAAEYDPDITAVLAINLLGNPCDFTSLRGVCDDLALLLFEDNCESLGASYSGDYCGTLGDLGTFSTFFSHHIQTMEGGIVVCQNKREYNLLLSLRSHGWTRGTSFDTGNPFEFITKGYNVRPGELNGAIGLEQLKKHDAMLSKRKQNGVDFVSHFGSAEYGSIQKTLPSGRSSWFGFGIVFNTLALKNKATKILDEEGVEYRPICTGNFTRQPVMGLVNEISGTLEQANKLHDNGIFLGNSPVDLSKEITRIGYRFKKELT